MCKIALWQWIFTKIKPAKSRPQLEIGQILRKRLDEDKANSKPTKLARIQVVAYGTRLLFRELLKELE